ncbi:hypothetical protein JCGZ_08719 [Jatropha curcas]|uniref:Uncharacterized protein n=1 Tax=Jatropha curcas TaxID=180498 RepID=A0A067KUW9_JATCU|nr:uncharacterized protein LOC105635777 [Jatropha curcas]KDP36075.1 hypothetical protein JCGZ_08719 [Jatropha curcas]
MNLKRSTSLIKIETNPTFLPADPPFINSTAMFFEIDKNGTAVAATPEGAQPYVSRQMFIHPPSPLIPFPSPSPSSPGSNNRRPLLRRKSHSISSNPYYGDRFAEFAGGTTAECAAVCCCCPCGLANLLYLTIYKVPAGLCRRALRKKRRKQLIKKGLLPARVKRCYCGCDDTELQIHPANGFHDSLHILKSDDDESSDEEEEEAMMKLEQEMWETFYGTGFWRSPSQKEPPTRRSNVSIDSPQVVNTKQL